MNRTKIVGAVIFVVVLTGCSGVAPGSSPPETTTTTHNNSSDTTTTEQTTVESTRTTIEQTTGNDKTPQKGDNLLSVQRINTSNAMKFNESSRINYADLSDSKKELFTRALQCDCNINQNQFSFHDEQRVKVVKYDGEYYYLRVAIV